MGLSFSRHLVCVHFLKGTPRRPSWGPRKRQTHIEMGLAFFVGSNSSLSPTFMVDLLCPCRIGFAKLEPLKHPVQSINADDMRKLVLLGSTSVYQIPKVLVRASITSYRRLICIYPLVLFRLFFILELFRPLASSWQQGSQSRYVGYPAGIALHKNIYS